MQIEQIKNLWYSFVAFSCDQVNVQRCRRSSNSSFSIINVTPPSPCILRILRIFVKSDFRLHVNTDSQTLSHDGRDVMFDIIGALHNTASLNLPTQAITPTLHSCMLSITDQRLTHDLSYSHTHVEENYQTRASGRKPTRQNATQSPAKEQGQLQHSQGQQQLQQKLQQPQSQSQ